MRKILSLIVFLLSYVANAQTNVFIDGIYYDLEYGKAKVVKNPNEYTGDVTIPEKVYYQNQWYTVQEIGDEAFSHNKKMTSLNLPNTLKKIGGNSILGCKGLKALVIPEQVQEIMFGALAFNDMKIVICLAKDVPKTGVNLVYASSPNKMILYVPSILVNAYKADAQWNCIKEILPIEDISVFGKDTKQISYLNHIYIGRNEKKQPLGGGQIEIAGTNIKGIFIENTIIGTELTNGPLTYKGNISFDESDQITLKQGGHILTEYYQYGNTSPKHFIHQLKTDSIINPANFTREELPMTYSHELNVPKELFPIPSFTVPYTLKLRSGKYTDISPEEKKELEIKELNGYKDSIGRIWDYSKVENMYKVTYKDGGFINSNNPDRMQYADGSYYLLNDKKKRYKTDGSFKITYDDGSYISSVDSTRRIYPDGSYSLTNDLSKRIYSDGTFILNGDESTRYNADGSYYKDEFYWKIIYPNGKYIESKNGYISTTDFDISKCGKLPEDEIVKMYKARLPYDLKKKNVIFKVKDNEKTDISSISFNKLVAANMSLFKNLGSNITFLSGGNISSILGYYQNNQFIDIRSALNKEYGKVYVDAMSKLKLMVGMPIELLADSRLYYVNGYTTNVYRVAENSQGVTTQFKVEIFPQGGQYRVWTKNGKITNFRTWTSNDEREWKRRRGIR